MRGNEALLIEKATQQAVEYTPSNPPHVPCLSKEFSGKLCSVTCVQLGHCLGRGPLDLQSYLGCTVVNEKFIVTSVWNHTAF